MNSIESGLYDDPVIQRGEVLQLRTELLAFRGAWIDQLARERNVRARDDAVRRSILERLAASDRLVLRIDALIALTDEAIRTGTTITGSSD